MLAIMVTRTGKKKGIVQREQFCNLLCDYASNTRLPLLSLVKICIKLFSCLTLQVGIKNPCHGGERNLAETTKSCKLHLSLTSLVKFQDAFHCTVAKPLNGLLVPSQNLRQIYPNSSCGMTYTDIPA